MSNLVLIDGNAVVHRAYHSMPKTFTDPSGNPTNAVYGFALTLIRVIEDLKPEYIVCSFDLAGPTFRHDKFEDYKATRVKADQELYDQIPVIKQLVETFGIKVLVKEGFEADDIIGTVVKKIKSTTQPKIYIVTGDKDTFQLVNGDVFIYDLKQGANQVRIIDRNAIKAKYDLEPEDFVDLKALAGDASDNIPGVPGIGDKTATALIKQFGNLDEVYKNLESELIKPRIRELLAQNKEQAYLSHELATIHKDVPIEFTLEELKWGEYDRENLRRLFESLGFRSLIARFGRASRTEEPKNLRTEERKTSVQKKDEQLKLL